MERNSRYVDIVDNMNDYSYHILGCGAIGSSAALQLARMGAENFALYDGDRVELQNIGVSQYNIHDVGKKKVECLKNHIMNITGFGQTIDKYFGIFPDDNEWKPMSKCNDIVILGFDSMAARLAAITNITKHKIKPFVVIDGRMGAEHYQQYILPKPTLKEYLKNWYPDSDSDPEPCTMKATSYCSNMSGSFIVNAVRKLITNQPYDKKFSFNFPTMILVK
jgi:molybdopterin/thiamine biosynthesis adenylyltransferase